MTLLSQAIGPLAARATCRSTSSCSVRCARRSTGASWPPTTRCPPSAISPPNSAFRASPCARRSTGWSSEGLLVRRQGSGTFVRGARREELLEAHLVLRRHARARAHAAQRVAEALRRDGHAGRSADAALEPRHAGLSLPPPALRRRRADVRSSTRPSSPTACPRSTPSTPRFTKRSSAPATVRCAPCSACVRCCSHASRRSCCARGQGDAGLLVERLGFLRDGRAVEFSQSYYRGDTYDFVAELSSLVNTRHPRMFREAAEAATACASSCMRAAARSNSSARAARASTPRAVVTCARGSSDHAATFAKIPARDAHGPARPPPPRRRSPRSTARGGPEGVPVHRDLAVGRQPRPARDRGRGEESRRPRGRARQRRGLAARARGRSHVPLRAGAETSVAATKSYIASLAAIVHLVATWTQDAELAGGARARAGPARTRVAARLERRRRALAIGQHLYVVGRGLGLGIAQEAALKFKETCGLHAEAFSAAEVRHGPMALVHAGFPVLAFAQHDETREGIEALARESDRRRRGRAAGGVRSPGRARAADAACASGDRTAADRSRASTGSPTRSRSRAAVIPIARRTCAR